MGALAPQLVLQACSCENAGLYTRLLMSASYRSATAIKRADTGMASPAKPCG